jgi:hypothetical protein
MDLDKDLIELADLLSNPLVTVETGPLGSNQRRGKWSDDPKVLVLMARLTIRLNEARVAANTAGAAHLMATDIEQRVKRLEELAREKAESRWHPIDRFDFLPTSPLVVELKGGSCRVFGFYHLDNGWEFVRGSGLSERSQYLKRTTAQYLGKRKFTHYREIV